MGGDGIGFGEHISASDLEAVYDEAADFIAERLRNTSPSISPQTGFHVQRLLQLCGGSLGDGRPGPLIDAAREGVLGLASPALVMI